MNLVGKFAMRIADDAYWRLQIVDQIGDQYVVALNLEYPVDKRFGAKQIFSIKQMLYKDPIRNFTIFDTEEAMNQFIDFYIKGPTKEDNNEFETRTYH